jgi:hypothetical protein
MDAIFKSKPMFLKTKLTVFMLSASLISMGGAATKWINCFEGFMEPSFPIKSKKFATVNQSLLTITFDSLNKNASETYSILKRGLPFLIGVFSLAGTVVDSQPN